MAALLLTFYVGASLDFYAREYLHDYGETTDCTCVRARCRAATIVDQPSIIFLHPVETVELLRTARWLD